MKYPITIGVVLVVLIFAVISHADRIDAAKLFDDSVTECRPPGDEGEKLVATLYKSADGGPLMLHCAYHSTIEVVK
jgi:hypothetical protein